MTRTLAIIVGIVAALTAGVLVYRLGSPPGAAPVLASGTVIDPPRPLPAIALRDHDDRPFGVDRLRNQWSLLFFGFANCGDICPVTLSLLGAMKQTVHDLPSESQPQIVFVSVDAQRDTPETLKRYVETFRAGIVGVTGLQGDLDAFAKALGVPSGIRPLGNGSYAVDHSGAVLAVNPQGEWRALFSPPHTVDALAADYRRLAGAL